MVLFILPVAASSTWSTYLATYPFSTSFLKLSPSCFLPSPIEFNPDPNTTSKRNKATRLHQITRLVSFGADNAYFTLARNSSLLVASCNRSHEHACSATGSGQAPTPVHLLFGAGRRHQTTSSVLVSVCVRSLHTVNVFW